jgi:hydrophobic/amphiphilic exporter-1 (mainly G- bacteria), HAE1 family
MKIIDFSTKRRVTIAMFTIGILLFGIVSLSRLSVNLLPELSYPTVTVRTDLSGAAPAEIENLISKPIEEALGIVKNVQKIQSISMTGQSDVILEFGWGTSMDHAILEIREKLESIVLPNDATRPVILRFDPSLDPIMRYAFYSKETKPDETSFQVASDITSDNISNLKNIRIFAEEQIKKSLESAEGVASVKISGGFEDEIQILVDQKKLSGYNLSVQTISQVLSAENINLSGGRLRDGSQQYMVRTVNQFSTVDQISDVIIGHANSRPVYLHEVADVRNSFKEREAITRLNGREAVEIAIYKEGDANTVNAAKNIKSRLSVLQNDLPENMEIAEVYDQSVFIESAVNEVVNAAIIGGILAVVILYLFLRNFWTTVIISVSIPVSVIATFNLMYGNDISLNIMSLGGIALGIGLLVDNSIVVLENIARHRDMGKSVMESAREGAGEVGMAVVASTLTTIAVFFPLIFVEGIAGQLFRDQSLTVTFALLVSLAVAVTLIPMMASLGERKKSLVKEDRSRTKPKTKAGRYFQTGRLFLFTTLPTFLLRWVLKGIRSISSAILFILNPVFKAFESGYNYLSRAYPVVLKKALESKAFVLTAALILFAGTLALIPQIGMELIPSLNQNEYRVEFFLPPGTPIDETDGFLQKVQNKSKDIDGIRTTFAVAGTGNRLDANTEQGGENYGEMNVRLAAGSHSGLEETTMASIRKELNHIPDLQYKFSRPALFTFNTPVEIEISGFDIPKLKEASERIKQRLAQSGRFSDVKSTMELGSPEVQILFDRDKAASLGLQVNELAQRVVSQVRGDIASRFSWQDRKIDMLVRVREQDRESIDKIKNLIVNPGSERPVTLDAIAEVKTNMGPSEIRRIAQQRVAVVTANLNYGDLSAAGEEIGSILSAMALPNGIYAQLTGQSEEMSSSFRSLLMALLLAVFLVYLIMASQFESLIHPFVILFTIPLAAIGAVWALYITGTTISVIVFIGLILLAGIVVNNAIVLIDLINQLRERGMEKYEAIIEGGKSRLRPILMTTMTTALGLLPLAIGFGDGAELRAPMAITVIGGLIVATMLTLIIIPVVYAIFDRKTFQS